MRRNLLLFMFLSIINMPWHSQQVLAQPQSKAPTLDEIIKSNRDLITDYALAQPEGPTYENIAPLMTPVRWVTASFRHFPVVLSAPSAPVKGRIVSNGSILNPLANEPPTWKEAGRALQLFVGYHEEAFGQVFGNTSEGAWLEGWKPLWQVNYQSTENHRFQLEIFAPVEPELAAQGGLFFQVKLLSSQPTRIIIKLADQTNQERLPATKKVLSKPGPGFIAEDWITLGTGWEVDTANKYKWSATIKRDHPVQGLLLTKPKKLGQKYNFQESRSACIRAWDQRIYHGPAWSIPESRLDNAWKAHLVAIHMTIAGNRPNYSAINAYDHLYMTEGSDLLRGLAYWGQFDTVKSVADAQFAFLRKDTQTAVAGLKLTLLRDLTQLLQDPDLLTRLQPHWQQACDFIIQNLDTNNGLPTPDRFAGDISGAVFNLRSSALCWRGLHDLALTLKQQGRHDEAQKISTIAIQLRNAIMKALAESEKLHNDPDFVPIGFFGKDAPVARIPDTQQSSYYNLVLGNVIESGLLEQDRESAIFRYLENRAGLSMGMPRTRPFWKNSPYYGQDGIAPLYGLKYAQARLRRNQPDHAIATLYGWLAHGMTRDSFIHGEGVRFAGGDDRGRYFHLPPNSASTANWLTLLRFLMIQEWDLNNDQDHETLRLLDATPRAWLADGKELSFKNVPTRFGPISLSVKSELAQGRVRVKCNLPKTPPGRTTIQFRLPQPYRAFQVESGGRALQPMDDQRFDITGLAGETSLLVRVKRADQGF